MPKHSKPKFGPTVPAGGCGGHGHSSHSSHSSSSSKAAPAPVVDPGWGTSGG
jgi:hypothetical protein